MTTYPVWIMNSVIILQVWSQMNSWFHQWLPVTQDYLVSVTSPVFLKQTRPTSDHPSKVLVQQGFETQGWQLTSDDQRKQILKNFKPKLKAKKFLRTFMLAVVNASCMRDLSASVSSQLHCHRSRKSGRDPRHLHQKVSS